MPLSRRGRRRLIVLATALALVAGGAFAFKRIKRTQQQRMAQEARAQGMAAYRAGDLPEAIAKLSYYFEHNKTDLEVNLVFAEARSRSPTPGGRHLFEAVELYTTHGLDLIDQQADAAAEQKQQQRREINSRLLSLYAQLGDRRSVGQTADQLLVADPNMIDALAAKAEVLFLGREYPEAQAIAERLVSIDPDSLTWRKMLLEVRSRQGASSAVLIEQCRVWSESYSADARFRLLTAAMLIDAGRTDDARAELHQTGTLSANSRAVLEQLVTLLDVLGLRSEADEALASSIARFPREWWPREVSIRRAWQNDQPQRALEEFEQSRGALGEPPASVHRLRVVAFIAAGRREDALTALEPLLRMSVARKELDADRTWAQAVAGALTADDRTLRDASQTIQMTLATSPHDPVLQFLLGETSMRMGAQARAIMAYQQAYIDAPNWSAAGVACGQALLAAGRLVEAYETARQVMSRSSEDQLQPFLLFAQAHVMLRESGRPADLLSGGDLSAEIIAALERLRAEQPRDVEITTLLVRAHFSHGSAAAAITVIRECAADDGASSELLLGLAEIARRRDPALEQSLLAKAQNLSGPSIEVAFARADLLARMGQADEGLRLIDQAIEAVGAGGGPPSTDRARAIQCARASYLVRVDHPAALDKLRTIVADHAGSVQALRFVLAQPLAWTDQRLIAQTMGDLRRLLGEDSLQVRLAEANFLLRFHPREPAMLARAIGLVNAALEESPNSLAALSLAAECNLVMADERELSGERGPRTEDSGLSGSSQSSALSPQHSPPSSALSTQSSPVAGGAATAVDRAIAHLEHAAALYPAEPGVLVRLIETLQQQGRYDAAHRHLQTLAQLTAAQAQVSRWPGGEVSGDQVSRWPGGEVSRDPRALDTSTPHTLTPSPDTSTPHTLTPSPLLLDELRLWQAQGDFESALVRASAAVDERSPVSQRLLLAALLERTGRMDEAEQAYAGMLEEVAAQVSRWQGGEVSGDQVSRWPGGEVSGDQVSRWPGGEVSRDPRALDTSTPHTLTPSPDTSTPLPDTSTPSPDSQHLSPALSPAEAAMILSQAAEFYAATNRYERGVELIKRMPLEEDAAPPRAPARALDTSTPHTSTPLPDTLTHALLLGMYADRHGRVDEARELLREAVELKPDSSMAREALARHLLAQGEALAAKEQALTGLRVSPGHSGLRMTLAIANLALPGADRSEAMAMLREQVAREQAPSRALDTSTPHTSTPLPDTSTPSADALLSMLELLEKTPHAGGRSVPTSANLAEARALVNRHPMFLPLWQLAISLHVEAGRMNEAVALAREAVGRLPGESQPSAWATELLMQSGRWGEALAEAQEWRRRTRANPLAADAATARVLLALGRERDALAVIVPHRQALMDQRRMHGEWLLTLVEAWLRTGEVEQARAVMSPLLAEEERWREAWIAAAGFMAESQAEATLMVMKDQARSPGERLALATQWLALAQRTGIEGHLSHAAELAQGVEGEAETAVGAQITLGAVAEMRQDLAGAERAYRAALAAAPQNAVALNNLAFVLALQGRFEDALPVIEQALKQQPDQPDFLDTRAAVMRAAGRLDEAERSLRRALDGRPEDASLLVNLADVQIALGKRDDAALNLAAVERRAASLSAALRTRVAQVRERLEAAGDAAASGAENSTASDAGSKPPVP